MAHESQSNSNTINSGFSDGSTTPPACCDIADSVRAPARSATRRHSLITCNLPTSQDGRLRTNLADVAAVGPFYVNSRLSGVTGSVCALQRLGLKRLERAQHETVHTQNFEEQMRMPMALAFYDRPGTSRSSLNHSNLRNGSGQDRERILPTEHQSINPGLMLDDQLDKEMERM